MMAIFEHKESNFLSSFYMYHYACHSFDKYLTYLLYNLKLVCRSYLASFMSSVAQLVINLILFGVDVDGKNAVTKVSHNHGPLAQISYCHVVSHDK